MRVGRTASELSKGHLRQPQGEELSVKSLPAELVEFDFPREVTPDYLFDLLAYGRLEQVSVYPREAVHFV